MKKIAVLVVAVFFASSGPVWACSLCDGLRGLGYTDTQISQVIRSSASRAEAETKMRQLIADGPKKTQVEQPSPKAPLVAVADSRPAEVKSQPVPAQAQPQEAGGLNSRFVTANDQRFRFSNEAIEVPPDIERR